VSVQKKALRSLLEHQVPEESVVYLTRSENDAISVGITIWSRCRWLRLAERRMGLLDSRHEFAGPFLEWFSIRHGARMCLVRLEDLALFRRVLNEGYSIVIVSNGFFQRSRLSVARFWTGWGLKTKKSSTSRSMVTTREVNGPGWIAYVVGRIALGDGALLLRDTVQDFLRRGNDQIILDLEDVDFIDSAGLGELVRSHMSVRSHGGQLKLVNPSASVQDLLNITKLDRVFDIPADEATALASFKTVRPRLRKTANGL